MSVWIVTIFSRRSWLSKTPSPSGSSGSSGSGGNSTPVESSMANLNLRWCGAMVGCLRHWGISVPGKFYEENIPASFCRSRVVYGWIFYQSLYASIRRCCRYGRSSGLSEGESLRQCPQGGGSTGSRDGPTGASFCARPSICQRACKAMAAGIDFGYGRRPTRQCDRLCGLYAVLHDDG